MLFVVSACVCDFYVSCDVKRQGIYEASKGETKAQSRVDGRTGCAGVWLTGGICAQTIREEKDIYLSGVTRSLK